MFVVVRRNRPAAVDEPGAGYNETDRSGTAHRGRGAAVEQCRLATQRSNLDAVTTQIIYACKTLI
jgi:hypothetical protein